MDFSLVIHFVGENHDFYVTTGVFFDLIQPDWDTLEALTIRQIKDDNNTVGSLVVSVSDCAVAFLACCVPDLKFDSALIDLQRAEAEVYADRADVVLLEAIVLKSSLND